MTIYVLDNGESYSDHQIWFVESDWPREVIEALMDVGEGVSVLLVASEIDWIDPHVTCDPEFHFSGERLSKERRDALRNACIAHPGVRDLLVKWCVEQEEYPPHKFRHLAAGVGQIRRLLKDGARHEQAETPGKPKEEGGPRRRWWDVIRKTEYVICALCGRTLAGYLPKGGDGSVLVPRPHAAPNGPNGLCAGRFLPGKNPGKPGEGGGE